MKNAENRTETRLCKHCQAEIPRKAKVCSYCGRKQGGRLKWIIVAVAVILVLVVAASGGDGADTPAKKTGEVVSEDKQDGTKGNDIDETDGNIGEEGSEKAVDNHFNVGDIVETDDLRISYLSAEEYTSDNEFMQPKEGNTYYRIEFEFENIGDSDQYVSCFDFNCYADGYAAEQTFLEDDDLSATLSPGKKVKGAMYYEVPKDASEVTLEYETDYWTEDKIIFVVK